MSGSQAGPDDGAGTRDGAGASAGAEQPSGRATTAPSSGPAPARRRRFSLRARLIALVVAVAALALVAVDVVIPLTTRSTLIAGKDRTLTSVVDSLPGGHMRLDQALSLVRQTNPLAGDIGWSRVTTTGVVKVIQDPAGYPHANPAVGPQPPTAAPTTVSDASGGDGTFRVLAAAPLQNQLTGQSAGSVVAWVPLADVTATMQRLILLEIVISVGLLVLLGLAAGFVVRREMRPLEVMARAADDIAAGDLSRRVAPGSPDTEVGRLGTAFNGMVDGVSDLLAQRDESERRMRQFVADASHELRTPVAAIRGYTDLYRAGALESDEAVDRAMDRMGFESQRMGALAGDLLTLMQADQTAEMPDETVDLVPLLEGVVDDAAVIDHERTWRLAGTGTRGEVCGDKLRLHQLFANLLANIRTHTPPGTTATVAIGAAEGVVIVSVSDDGPGVAPEDLPRLTDRFFRVDKARSRERGGSGLGLSIAAAIVRMHHGGLAASNAPSGGLTMTVVLPVAVPRGEPTPPPGGVTLPPTGPSDGSDISA